MYNSHRSSRNSRVFKAGDFFPENGETHSGRSADEILPEMMRWAKAAQKKR